MNYLQFILCCLLFSVTACKKENKASQLNKTLSAVEKEKLRSIGLNAEDILVTDNGVIVEGDIFFSNEALQNIEANAITHTKISEEHYRSVTTIGGLDRVIRVSVDPLLPKKMFVAVDSALQRYNNLSLRISFVRVTTAPDIVILNNSIYPVTGISGFPSGGNPPPVIQVNTLLLSSWSIPTITTVITHLLGHAMGFLHTDLMNAAYSCNSGGTRDSIPSVPGTHIPGTPTGASANSWMLTCISDGINRPFNTSDITALNYLY
jgi:hypothetical protein